MKSLSANALLFLGLAFFSPIYGRAIPDPQTGPPIPPSGKWCCPPTGPNGSALVQPQPGPFALWCLYDGNNLCGYDTATGGGATIPGCPPEAILNPHPPTCPV